MADRPEWFAPKRFGYGFGLPIAWQGWAALLVYTVALYLASHLFDRSTVAFAAAVIAITAMFLWVAARTTRGGWRFRQGEED
jgi:hypothetical protein